MFRFACDHDKLTHMQKIIMDRLKEINLCENSCVDTTKLLDYLVENHGKGKREWQGSLLGLGKKRYITYGSGIESIDNGISVMEKGIDYIR